MKHHAHTLIYLACLAIAWLLCSCRSTLQNNRSTQEQSNLSITDSALRIRTEDTYSRFNPHTVQASDVICRQLIEVGCVMNQS